MWIEAGCLITANSDFEVLKPGWIEVVDGSIAAVRDSKPSDPIDLDLSSQTVLPGFVNTHAHVFQTVLRGLFEGLTLAEFLPRVYNTGIIYTPDDSRAAARLGGFESLRAGVTTVLDHHFLNRGNDLASATIEGLRSVGIRTVMARTIMDQGSMTPEPLLEPAATGLDYVAELLSVYHDEVEEGNVSIYTGSNTPGVNVSPEAMRATSDFAKSEGIKQSMHVAEHPSIVALVRDRYGTEGVVALLDKIGVLDESVIAAHAVQLSDAEIETMAEAGASVSHNPVSNLMAGDGVARVTRMRASGISVGIGTDGPASAYHMDMLEPTRLAAALQRGLEDNPHAVTSKAAIRMATIEAAEAIGVDRLVGSIEPGKRADLVSFKLEGPHNVGHHDPVAHLVFAARADNVSDVLIDGDHVVRDGELVKADSEEIRFEGDQVARRLATLV